MGDGDGVGDIEGVIAKVGVGVAVAVGVGEMGVSVGVLVAIGVSVNSIGGRVGIPASSRTSLTTSHPDKRVIAKRKPISFIVVIIVSLL